VAQSTFFFDKLQDEQLFLRAEKKYFRIFWAIFWVGELSQKECV